MIFFVVLVPLKIMLLIWLMTQEWFWVLVGWVVGLAVCITVIVLIAKALGGA